MRGKQFHTVLIFGGSGEIGRAIGQTFGQKGWAVGLHFNQHRSSASETATVINEVGGKAFLYQADVTKSSKVREVFQAFSQTHGSLNVLVWAIGVPSAQLLLKTSSEDWIHTLQTNLTGTFHVLQEAGPIFEKQKDGAVVLLGSLSGEQGSPGQAAYAASKAGLIGLMRTTAKEWGSFNIRVNAIFPGWHESPLSESGFDTALHTQNHVLNRTPSLNKVANTVYHLALARDISGQVWNLDSRIW
ncbi:MAG: SDR family NAD(P)-dependent oxidoreductase [Nitrospirales bacterium]|jgi:3-oxoacyl-[acyl-carrier protein] reductase